MIASRPRRIDAGRYEAQLLLGNCEAVAGEHSNIIRAAKEPEL